MRVHIGLGILAVFFSMDTVECRIFVPSDYLNKCLFIIDVIYVIRNFTQVFIAGHIFSRCLLGCHCPLLQSDLCAIDNHGKPCDIDTGY